MKAALIADAAVMNVVILTDGTRLTRPLAASFGGDTLVAVPDDLPVGPGWGYDPGADPQFTAPDIPDPTPPPTPAPDPVQAVIAAIGAIAAQDGPTLNEKLAAIVDVLAQNAPSTPAT